jgi:hypothetical protein
LSQQFFEHSLPSFSGLGLIQLSWVKLQTITENFKPLACDRGWDLIREVALSKNLIYVTSGAHLHSQRYEK